MKKILGLLSVMVFMFILLIGCSSGQPTASQKSEEELRAEIKAELEAEKKKEEELEVKIRTEVEAELKAKEEQKEKETKPEPKPEPKPSSSTSVLLESNGVNYYKYKPNEMVSFDLDGDGTDEKIKYDTQNRKIMVNGYKDIELNGESLETDYFIIIKFSDRFDTKMNMIGILDYGPSADYLTTLYAIVQPMGEKSLVSVGAVAGEIVTPDKFDENNMDDFNYKAVLYENKGIEAPVRLSILPYQTWFGRNMFTYYSTYVRLVDNIDTYETDYITHSELKTAQDIKAYNEKDLNSKSVTIKAGQKVYLLATDNQEWIAMLTDDGIGGWMNIKEVTMETFTGYIAFD